MKRAFNLLRFAGICFAVAAVFLFFYAPSYSGLIKPERYFYYAGIRCGCGYAMFDMIDHGQYYELCPGHDDLRWRGYLQKEGDKTIVMFSGPKATIPAYLFDPITKKLKMIPRSHPNDDPYPIPMVHSAWQILAEFYWVDALHFVCQPFG